jgi:hypothetical protein
LGKISLWPLAEAAKVTIPAAQTNARNRTIQYTLSQAWTRQAIFADFQPFSFPG